MAHVQNVCVSCVGSTCSTVPYIYHISGVGFRVLKTFVRELEKVIYVYYTLFLRYCWLDMRLENIYLHFLFSDGKWWLIEDVVAHWIML